jgi:hypothetical protein
VLSSQIWLQSTASLLKYRFKLSKGTQERGVVVEQFPEEDSEVGKGATLIRLIRRIRGRGGGRAVLGVGQHRAGRVLMWHRSRERPCGSRATGTITFLYK